MNHSNQNQNIQPQYKKAVVKYMKALSDFFDIITAISFLSKDWSISVATLNDVPRYVFSVVKGNRNIIDIQKILGHNYLKILKKKESATFADLNEILLNIQMLIRFYSFFITVKDWSLKKIIKTFENQSFDEYKYKQQAPPVKQLSIANL